MRYDVSGAFGEVRLYPSSVPTDRFRSIDHISHIGWHRVNDLYRINRINGHTESLLLLTRSGRGEIQVGSKKYIAVPGTIAIIPHDVYTTYGSLRGEVWEFNWLHYYGSHADSITGDIVKQQHHVFNTSLQEIDLLFKPFTQNHTNEIDGELTESEALYTILQILLKRSVSVQRNRTENILLNTFMQSVNEENGTAFSLEEFAQKCHYSKEYIIRTIKKATGMTPYHYQKLLILKRSCDALAAGSLSIGEVAAMCGYQNVGSYSTEFKKHFNISPSDYRKQHKLHQN